MARRATLILLASSLALVASGDLLGRHSCPHHQPDSAPAGHEHGHGHASGHHAGHGEAHAPAPPHQDHDHGTPCTCVGACHVSAATPLYTAAGSSIGVGAMAALVPELPPTHSPAVRLLPYVLPYPNGPPAHG